MKISGYIITYNEEKHIGECLDTLTFCDEIIIVDSDSADKTQAVIRQWAKKNKKVTVKIVNRSFSGFIEQKNFAISQTSHDWVFNLDADERASPELRLSLDEIKTRFTDKETGKITSFSMNRRNRYIDAWVKYSGWYPDRKIRLFHKKHAKWDGQLLHETVLVKSGTTVHLSGDILHYSFESISDHIKKIDKYTTISANQEFQAGKSIYFASIFIRMATTFMRSYIVKRGILEGKTGLLIAVMASYHTFLKTAKLWYLHRTGKL